MKEIDITLRLPEGLVDKARDYGILNVDHIARLLEAEIERLDRWQKLDSSLESACAEFKADHADLSEQEMMALIDDVVHDVRRESDHTPDST